MWLAWLQLYVHFTFHVPYFVLYLYNIYSPFISMASSVSLTRCSMVQTSELFERGEAGRVCISARRTLHGRVIGKASALRWCSVQAPIILMSRRLLCVFLFYHPDYNYSFCFIHEQPQTEHDQTPCQTREIVCVCRSIENITQSARCLCLWDVLRLGHMDHR